MFLGTNINCLLVIFVKFVHVSRPLISEVPQCDSNHCNNGDCAELAGDGMICNCLDGYTGPSCNISVCHSNPCVKGDCQVKVDGTLNCLCDVGWHGKLCTDGKSPCCKGENWC